MGHDSAVSAVQQVNHAGLSSASRLWRILSRLQGGIRRPHSFSKTLLDGLILSTERIGNGKEEQVTLLWRHVVKSEAHNLIGWE
jgi:hypothetical protein